MSKRLLEYISIFGILLCLGLLLYNMTELKKISAKYDRLQKEVAQVLADKRAAIQISGSNEPETTSKGFFGDSYLEKRSDSLLEWDAEPLAQNPEQSIESGTSYYSLEKEEYLHSEPLDVKSDTSAEIPMRTYWEWEWEGPTISPEEAAQYDLVKYGYLME